MIAKNMHVGDKKSIKLTKRGDCLEGSINRVCKFREENPNCKSDIVLLAGTNDLRKHQSSAESLAGSLVDFINKLISSSTNLCLQAFTYVWHCYS